MLVNKIIKIIKNNKKFNADKKINFNNLINFVEDRLGHDYRYDLDTSKIYKQIGFKPLTSIDKGLIKTITWYAINS